LGFGSFKTYSFARKSNGFLWNTPDTLVLLAKETDGCSRGPVGLSSLFRQKTGSSDRCPKALFTDDIETRIVSGKDYRLVATLIGQNQLVGTDLYAWRESFPRLFSKKRLRQYLSPPAQFHPCQRRKGQVNHRTS
jgi:hypothetical protein